AGRPGSPAGRIINAAGVQAGPGQETTWHLFMEINLNDVGQVDFRAVSAEGPAIALQPLPYSLEPGEAQ
ncbi:MAG: folate-binding protein, partial [Alcaligenaceae bacterium]|nr:folate-binding protein [Alcaligenaceae bacterium]